MKFTSFLHRVIIGKNDRAEQQLQPKPVSPSRVQISLPENKTTPAAATKPDLVTNLKAETPIEQNDNSVPYKSTPTDNGTAASLSHLDMMINQLNPSQKILLENFAQQLINRQHTTDAIPNVSSSSPNSLPSSRPSEAASIQAEDQTSQAASEEDSRQKVAQASEFINSLAQDEEKQTYSRANIDFYKKESAQEEIRIPERDVRLDNLRQLLASSVKDPRGLGRILASNHF
ncbi:MAG: hypothetical protein ABF703_05360 [Oenococcus sp.]|uniref:hypothetical protein n=1 Tax=Oenococcus TaxID=46254 RepID=UPI0021E906C7|nr:hypothetical protein [Oenococcus kitaharae]MCV3296268.1 hypothetical protein [Oenococcus kitaharae]